MADKKISQLTGATTPLAGTEVLPIVQSGGTVKVAISDVTAGRAITATSITVGSGRTRLASTYVADVPGPTGNNTGILFGGNTIFPCDGTGTVTNGAASLGSTSYRWYDLFLANNVVVAAGKGVDFSANANAPGMTKEVLTWYEEGAWTPTMTSASGTTTVNTSSGRYTRIGDKVFVVFRIDYTTDASVSTSNFTIGGLPFTSRATFNSRGFVSGSNWSGSDYNDGYVIVNSSATTLTWGGRAVNQNSRTNAVLLFSADYFAA